MKVILTEEVIGLGEPGSLVDVAPGYARNYLVPRNFAVYADKTSLKELEHHKRRLERKRQRLHTAAMSLAERIQGQTLTIKVKVGKEGKLYGSVTTVDIATLLQQALDVTIDRRKLHLKEPIRTVGSHEVTAHLLGDTNATFTVEVVDEAQAAVPAAAPVVETVETPASATE